jgi:hypothetical protein
VAEEEREASADAIEEIADREGETDDEAAPIKN